MWCIALDKIFEIEKMYIGGNPVLSIIIFLQPKTTSNNHMLQTPTISKQIIRISRCLPKLKNMFICRFVWLFIGLLVSLFVCFCCLHIGLCNSLFRMLSLFAPELTKIKTTTKQNFRKHLIDWCSELICSALCCIVHYPRICCVRDCMTVITTQVSHGSRIWLTWMARYQSWTHIIIFLQKIYPV